ncbi:uncharacterized protein LOC142172753 [Nicotiana tabacum]|uniref:Uncharacterized protein LOC142172753 n=1 Tax=Nicotiana tabacum TaxID=4097 RepID=A0AC58T5L7_TOBAC
MSKIAIMLQLNGNWDNYGRFRDFEVDVIVVDENASYSILISTIAEQLFIDTSEKIVEIKYMVNDNCPLMEIRNDMGVRVYMETKKENKNLGSYSLCISVRDFNMELAITNDNTSASSSGSLKLLDMPSSPAIEDYQSEIITESTQTVIEEGQVYQDKQTVVAAMKHFSVMHKFQFRVKRSSHRSYWLVCVGENCKWHFKATSINDSAMFKIRSFNRQHTCSLMDETFIQRKRIAVVVGSMVIRKYCDPKTVYTSKDIQTDMLSEHGVNLSYMQSWRAKEKALQFLRGNPADSYSKLPKYFYILEETYPGSVVKLKKTTDECFLYAFVTLCTILSLAYAVVDSENDESWKWFFEQFKQAYDERPSMCVVSDRNESILKSYTLDEFNERMSKIEEVDPRVKSYLYDIGYHRWSRVHATVNRTWTMTSNIVESLNAVRASTDHIHTVLDGVKRYIVCLENKKCSCGQFQLEELPCVHALAALRHRNETYENYCSSYYTRESLLRTYEIPVNHLPDESKWNVPQHILDEVVNLPMGDKRQPGRPQKERYKTYDEIKSKKYKVSCENFGGEGHNKRSYKNAPKKK